MSCKPQTHTPKPTNIKQPPRNAGRQISKLTYEQTNIESIALISVFEKGANRRQQSKHVR